MAAPNEQSPQCECAGCDIDRIKNIDEDFRMTPCPIVINGCKAIRKLLKKGFFVDQGPQNNNSINDGEYFDEFVSRKELIKAITHTLVLWHPNKVNYIKFILARYRTCVSIHDLYWTCGFYVSDNHSMAFLRFKTNKKLSCYFISMTSSQVIHTDINIELTDKEMCSIYLYNGCLWIVQNSEIGVINVAYIRVKDNPVKCFVRNFGTMDYWNPYSTRRVVFTDTELCHEFLHVTLDTKRTKIIRKHVSTMKNAFLVPVGNRQVVIYYDVPTQEVMLDFFIKEDKLKALKSVKLNARFEQRNYSFAFSDITKLVVVRINTNTTMVLDMVNCSILKTITLNNQYDLNRPIQFMFSSNGRRLLVLGAKKNTPDEYFWTQHLFGGIQTLKHSALKAVREKFLIDDLRKLDVPKTLRYELTFGRI